MKEKPTNPIDKLFGNKLFDIEHALSMYAISYCTLPAEGLYDQDKLKEFKSVIDKCHIYIIGYLPAVKFITANQKEQILTTTYSVLGKDYTLEWELPSGFTFHIEDNLYYVENTFGQKSWPSEEEIMLRLKQKANIINFEVKYIGQSYGKDGSRNAVDRLLKHETLQRISLKGIPDEHILTLMLIEVQPDTQMFTLINPWAENKDEDGTRIKAGLDKLYGTTEKERIALYEAALIRYFYPDFNKEFKNSFPSTNLKVLQDCYDKDFASVIAEICIDDLPFKLYSKTRAAENFHIAKHDLHNDEARTMFFKSDSHGKTIIA